MRRLLAITILLLLPFEAACSDLEQRLRYNLRIITMQQQTDVAVSWIEQHGYHDRVAAEFVWRCGLLRLTRGGMDWCGSSYRHRRIIGMALQYGSKRTRWLVDSYHRRTVIPLAPPDEVELQQ